MKDLDEYGMDAIHTVELDMLKAVAHLCEDHGLRYSIYCGTLLGAVRHKGFIPWDDDVDIAMPLKDFRRFKKVVHKLPERFSCVCFDNTPDSIWPWIRIVANGHPAGIYKPKRAVGLVPGCVPNDRRCQYKAWFKAAEQPSICGAAYSVCGF